MELPELHFQFLPATLFFIAGFIDSIAGGGGLITLPVLTLLVGPGAAAIGTNKIFGTTAALTALVVYSRKGHLQWKNCLPFLIAIAIGTVLGAKTALILPISLFKYALTATCPILLWLVFKRESFAREDVRRAGASVLFFVGLATGFYDGVYGPGGGTFMFLGLNLLAGLPLLSALAASKLANTLSAGFSLASFTLDGQVLWVQALAYVPAVFLGAILGSQLASRRAQQIVRPVLVGVVVLLLVRIWI